MSFYYEVFVSVSQF